MTTPIKLSKTQARTFLLQAQHLVGPRMLRGQRGVLKVLKDLRAVQVDPIDVAGVNHDLVLRARVAGYTHDYLDAILYEKRQAFEYWLKCLCILPIASRPYYEARMRRCERWFAELLEEHADTVRRIEESIRQAGPKSPADFDDARRVRGGWSGDQRLIKKLMEALWETGRLAIHHREGRRRFYDLAERTVPRVDEPPDEEAFHRRAIDDLYHAMRLFRAKGNGGVTHFVRRFRGEVHAAMLDEGTIAPVSIRDVNVESFMLADDVATLDELDEPDDTVRLLPPMDNALWDRQLVEALFGFRYAFEAYKPRESRQYGYYCLPVLYGTKLVGRVDAAVDRAADRLRLKAVHWEESFRPGERFLQGFVDELADLCRYLGVASVSLPPEPFKARDKLGALL